MDPSNSIPPEIPSQGIVGFPPSVSSRNVELDTIAQQAKEIAQLREQNEALADAVVNSAEIIEELEQTRRKLAEAQAAAELAHQNTQRMAKTIFEGSHDGMIVLDRSLKLLSANRNARDIFGLGPDSTGMSVIEELGKQYSSAKDKDWSATLFDNKEQRPRMELFRFANDSLTEATREKSTYETLLEKFWIEISISPLATNQMETEFLLTARDITQRKRIEEQFQHQALHDNVTGLPNRRFFVKEIESLLLNPNAEIPFSVCFLDLDNFKTVNDTLGHEAGDQLLIQVAQRIKTTTRGDSFLARFGGDEFALLIPRLTTEEVTIIGNRIVNVMKQPFKINGNTVFIGASIGMTRFPDDSKDANQLLQNADVAMYRAKVNGRSCFHSFTPELAAGIQEKQSLLDDLHESLEKRDIALEYQPKWCLKTNQVAGCEALLRWRRNGQAVSAWHLIEVAECSGLILPLGDLILEKAVQQMAQWRSELSLNGQMAINLSPRQLSDQNFPQRFVDIINRAGVPAGAIELEITETAMMENFSEASERIQELQQLGVSIAIDDFGTGYSSLSYLKNFPVSTLKIDRSFVCDLPSDPKAIAVAKAVLSLGHGLGLNVVAEGVETQEQNQFLIDSGCDKAQGYLFSRSLTPEQFVSWVKESKEIAS